MDGNIKKEDANGFMYTKDGMPVSPAFGGYDDYEYYKNIVKATGDRLEVKEIK